MIIDTHQHYWTYRAAEYGWIDESMTALKHTFLPGDALQLMARANVDACVAVQARQSLEETEWLLAQAEAQPRIVGVIGWVDLQSTDVRSQLDRWRRRKLVGVRHLVQDEPDDRFLLRAEFRRGIAELGAFDLTYDILIHPRHLGVADEFVSRFDRQWFVLDHLAKPDIRHGEIRLWERGLRRLAAHPNVYAKISGLVTEADWGRWTPAEIRPYLDVAFDCFGARRLMIGSDWPVCTLAADYVCTMGVVTEYLSDFSADDRNAVLGGNAQRLWNVNEAGLA